MDMYIDLEQIRQEYKPEFIRVLFIGESPPNSGTFFYLDDPYRTFLLRYTRDAFEDVYHQKWQEPGSFLLFFRSRGCYLDDLCHKPINHLEKKSRLIKSDLLPTEWVILVNLDCWKHTSEYLKT